jgi:hypothetical protein
MTAVLALWPWLCSIRASGEPFALLASVEFEAREVDDVTIPSRRSRGRLDLPDPYCFEDLPGLPNRGAVSVKAWTFEGPEGDRSPSRESDPEDDVWPITLQEPERSDRPDPGRERSARLSVAARRFGGQVQVREHAFPATPLSLGADLGYGYQVGGRLNFTYAGGELQSSIDVEYLDGTARESARRDFFFNGAPYQTGEPLKTLTHFLTVRIQVAWKAVGDRVGGDWTGPVIGLEYPYYYMNLTSPSIPGNSEDWTHYYPYPVIGWAGRVELAEGLSWGGRATLGYLPNVASAYLEGGRLYVSVRPSVWVELPLTWTLSPSFRLSASFEYQLWHGADHSVEDGNVLRFSSPGVSLGATLAW